MNGQSAVRTATGEALDLVGSRLTGMAEDAEFGRL
jgi:hypothetical protein